MLQKSSKYSQIRSWNQRIFHISALNVAALVSGEKVGFCTLALCAACNRNTQYHMRMFNFPSRRKSNIQQNGGKEKASVFRPWQTDTSAERKRTDKLWLSIRLYSWPGCLTPLACGDRRLELCLAADHTSVRETVETEIKVRPFRERTRGKQPAEPHSEWTWVYSGCQLSQTR